MTRVFFAAWRGCGTLFFVAVSGQLLYIYDKMDIIILKGCGVYGYKRNQW